MRTALGPLHEARGAFWMEHHGWEIPARFGELATEYGALQEGAALLDLSYRQLLRVTGRDRRSWLHGQVTQDVNSLPDGRSAYAVILTPQGRMVADLRILATPDALFLDAPAGTAQPLAEHLERFLIMERAEIQDLTTEWALVSVQGPLSPCAIASVFGRAAREMERYDVRVHGFAGGEALVTRSSWCGEDGFDVLLPAPAAPLLWASFCQARPSFRVDAVGWEALNLRRLEAGIPWWGAELDAGVNPLEARLDHAISLTKGCYVGQEIIARIEARGQVNNLLAGFLVHGEPPARDTEIRHQGRRVGRITSSGHSPRLGRAIALGYLRREHQEPGTRLDAEDAAGALEVTSLPFVPDDYPSRVECADE